MRLRGIVIHCTANQTGKNFSVKDLYNYHVNELKYESIGYHFVVDEAGIVYNTRKLTEQGAHCYGYNDYVGIAYIGGIDEKGRPSNTLNKAQIFSLTRLCYLLCIGLDIHSSTIKLHHELNPKKACPSFSRNDWDIYMSRYLFEYAHLQSPAECILELNRIYHYPDVHK